MPTYEYKCDECGEITEAFHGIAAPPLTDCEKCGAQGTMKRLISSGAGLIFKGSGFYITDYKKKESGSAGGGNGKKAETESKSETKSETQSETKDKKTETTSGSEKK